jgi:signal transduction histidine kinase
VVGRRGLAALAAAGVGSAGATIALVLTSDAYAHDAPWVAAIVSVGLGWIGAGIAAMARRRHNPIGPIMAAVGFCFLLAAAAGTQDGLVLDVGVIATNLALAGSAHLLLAFPSGRLEALGDRVVMTFGYLIAGVIPIAVLHDVDQSSFSCEGCPRTVLLADRSDALIRATVLIEDVIAVGVATWVVVMIWRRRRVASAPLRRAMAPVVFAGSAEAVVFALGFGGFTAGLPREFTEPMIFATFVAFGSVPYAYLAGLARSRFTRGVVVGDLVAALGGGGAGTDLRAALATALDDPTLSLAYWLPERGIHVDERGLPVELPPLEHGRTATPIEHEGERVGAILHDVSLTSEEPELVRDAGAAAALALEHRRLEAELRARVQELRRSRMRLVRAGDEARRRIERDLHDGAQQRLVALALALRSIRRRAPDGSELASRLDAAEAQLAGGLEELRELARGIHPAVLTDRGLGAAIRAAAARSPVPVEVGDMTDERFGAEVEAAAYFVVAEALTNVAKYAGECSATVAAVRADGRLVVEVADDGCGGADPAAGSGLRGLADRVAAVDGRLTVISKPDAGTRVRAELPVPARRQRPGYPSSTRDSGS